MKSPSSESYKTTTPSMCCLGSSFCSVMVSFLSFVRSKTTALGRNWPFLNTSRTAAASNDPVNVRTAPTVSFACENSKSVVKKSHNYRATLNTCSTLSAFWAGPKLRESAHCAESQFSSRHSTLTNANSILSSVLACWLRSSSRLCLNSFTLD